MAKLSIVGKCLEWIFSSLLFVGCFIFVLYRGAKCFEKYMERPRTMDVTYVNQTLVDFPALTFCPEYFGETPAFGPMAYNLNILEECQISGHDMFFGWYHGSSLCNASYIMKNIFPTLDDFGFKYFEVFSGDGAVIKKILPCDSRLIWTPWHLPEYGKCFTLRFSDDVTKSMRGVSFIYVLAGYKQFRVYLHSFGKLVGRPEMATGVTGWNVRPGKKLQILLENLEYVEYLNTEVDGVCNDSLEYFQDQCVTDLIRESSLDKVQCLIPFGKNTGPLCSERNLAWIAFEQLREGLYGGVECQVPCRHLMNTISSINVVEIEDQKNATSFLFFFKREVKKSQSRVIYGELELMAEVGGYVGLFLGMSVFQIRLGISTLLTKIFSS